jgi:hypothetical protein
VNDRSRKDVPGFKVAVRARIGGGYTYQIFAVAGEPRTLQINDKGFTSPEEAERAGYEALALTRQSPE